MFDLVEDPTQSKHTQVLLRLGIVDTNARANNIKHDSLH